MEPDLTIKYRNTKTGYIFYVKKYKVYKIIRGEHKQSLRSLSVFIRDIKEGIFVPDKVKKKEYIHGM